MALFLTENDVKQVLTVAMALEAIVPLVQNPLSKTSTVSDETVRNPLP